MRRTGSSNQQATAVTTGGCILIVIAERPLWQPLRRRVAEAEWHFAAEPDRDYRTDARGHISPRVNSGAPMGSDKR